MLINYEQKKKKKKKAAPNNALYLGTTGKRQHQARCLLVRRGACRTKRQHLLVRQAPRGCAKCTRVVRKLARSSRTQAGTRLARGMSISRARPRLSYARLARIAHLAYDSRGLTRARCACRAHLLWDSRSLAREMRMPRGSCVLQQRPRANEMCMPLASRVR